MFQDIRLHGQINDKVEYFATVAGQNISNRYFHESGSSGAPDSSPFVRFFSPGNEFSITSEGVSFNATGGSFCEYMFGIDLPIKDLVKKSVLNRLVMNGGVYAPGSDSIAFTDEISGSENFERIFFNGNAVSNYFFFVHSPVPGQPSEMQRRLLGRIGKYLKHTEAVGRADDAALVRELFLELRDDRCILFLFRLVHRYHREYYSTFKSFYDRKRSVGEDESMKLADMADLYGLDRYQTERIKIDVMYKNPENKRIVDEYKGLLIACTEKDVVDHVDLAKLTRLRTLSIRNHIPLNLFDTLDELLLKGKRIKDMDEPEYIKETRSIFEGLSLKGPDEGHVNNEDLVKLLVAKQQAIENKNSAFEEILLESCRIADEKATASDDMTPFESFGYIITYFDRFDNTNAAVSQLSFMEDADVSEEKLRSLLGNKRAFEKISPGLFHELFIKNAMSNRYITGFGRRKVSILYSGLRDIEDGNASYRQVLDRLTQVIREERHFSEVHAYMKSKMKNFYTDLSDKEAQDDFISEVWKEMLDEKLISPDAQEKVFRDAVMSIRKEYYYLQNFLPVIVAGKSSVLREDFLTNSGLDRFYVEELEREYFEKNNIALSVLDRIRKEETGALT